jgi:hypothetical protein
VDLLDDRVPTVDLVRRDRVGDLAGRGGEERVMAPLLEQRALAGHCVQVGDPAHHQPPGHLVGRAFGGERDEVDLGHLGSGDPPAGGLVEDRVGVLDGGHLVLVDRGLHLRIQGW